MDNNGDDIDQASGSLVKATIPLGPVVDLTHLQVVGLC